MKKYLMTGMAALAMCAAFTSCSKDTDFSDVREQNSQVNYETAFVSKYGQIASNQDWGFGQFRYKGANARVTRTADPRGNMWASEGWKVPPVISTAQKNIVRQYFQQVKPIGYNDPQWSNFWIQQVYKGGSNAGTGSGSLTTETYTIGNGDAVVGGDHMDHLCSKSQAGVEDHVNNFNNSDNNTWEGRMLMINSSTYSFGYINSNATAIHYDKAALVNWRVIAQWAVDNKLESSVESSVLNDGWNRSYMGFDWEQALPEYCYSRTVVTEGGWTSPDNYEPGATYENGFKVKSITYNTFEFEGKEYKFLSANANQYAYDESEPTYGGKKNYSDKPSDAIIRDLLSKGYLPYSDTLKDWIKLSTGADGYYSDWIVTLTEATKTEGGDPTEPGDGDVDVRVLAEDLDVTENYSNQTYRGDFDFNDVVFDVVYDFKGDTWIILRAAGGTWPIFVDGNDVHAAFGEASNVMINTQASGGKDGKAAVKINLHKSYTDANNIPVTVTLPSGETRTLTAGVGLAPHKLAVDPDFTWMRERRSIEEEHPNFSNWVKDPETKWYGAAGE